MYIVLLLFMVARNAAPSPRRYYFFLHFRLPVIFLGNNNTQRLPRT